MCGICGVYSLTTGNLERELFESLLMLNVYRGRDSTGVIRMNEPGKGGLTTARRAVASSPRFITSSVGNELIWDLDKKATKDHSKTIGFIGHCRAATKGEVKVQNAHPFRFPNVVGVHNGTIRYSFKGSSDYETDSEALYALINEVGIEEALNAVRNSSPAYALAYVDSRDKTLNFVRNGERPLYFTYLYGKTTLVWSSEADYIKFALDRRSGTLQRESWAKDVGKDGFFTLEEHTLLSIPLGKSSKEATLKKLDVKKGVTVYTTSSHTVGAGLDWDSWDDYLANKPSNSSKAVTTGGSTSTDGYGNFREKHGAEGLSNLPWLSDEPEESKTSSPAGKATPKARNDKGAAKQTALIVQQEEFKRLDHKGEPVSQSERNFRLSRGCFCCGTPVSPTDSVAMAKIQWWNRQFFACGDCYDNTNGETSWVRLSIDGEVPTEMAELISAMNTSTKH